MSSSAAKRVAINLYWKFRSSSDFILPRYTPMGWWECDVWRLTKAGKVDEYEIKLSVGDFRADVKKEQKDWVSWQKEREGKRFPCKDPEIISKHQLLKEGDPRCPNRFWFVVPDEIADRIVVPSYAGLMTFNNPRAHAWVKKQAPQIHGKKWDGDRVRLLHTFYHRYWSHESKSKDADIETTIVEPES